MWAAVLGACLLLWAATASASCSPRHLITFPDGGSACLTDYPLAEQRATGSLGAMQRQVPAHGGYQLALPRRPAMCPAAIGFWAMPGNNVAAPTAGAGDIALPTCRRAAGQAAPGTACECLLVVVSGASQVPRADFERMAREAGMPASMPFDPRWRAEALAVAAPSTGPPGAGAASAEAGGKVCPPRYSFVFADGAPGCLTDYALAEDSARGWVGPLRRSVPGSGNYSIAASPRRESCTAATGFASNAANSSSTQLAIGTDPAQRSAKALRDCSSQLGSAAESCACQLLLADGRSPLTRPAFEAFVGHLAAAPVAGPASAAVPAVAAAPLAASRATLTPGLTPPPAAATSRPEPTGMTTTTAASAPTPSNAELAALRQQLEALQAQVAKQSAQPPAAEARAGPARQRSRALVIGNGAYAQLGTLPNPRRDAQAIAAKLRQFGIEVDLVLDANRSALVKALSDYQSQAAGYDVNILFYAGHGLQVGGVNYIVPVDMAVSGASVGSVKLNSVSLNDALDYLPARTRIVFLDACRDNPLSRSLMATRSSGGLGLAPVSTTGGTLVAYATRDGSVAEDGSGSNSPYTSALLQHLDADEDIAVVLRRVRQTVLKATSNRQEPWEYGSLVGEKLVLSKISKP